MRCQLCEKISYLSPGVINTVKYAVWCEGNLRYLCEHCAKELAIYEVRENDKCSECGSKEWDYGETWYDEHHFLCEYEKMCAKCGNKIGHWANGRYESETYGEIGTKVLVGGEEI